MASIENRSRYVVTVQNRVDLAGAFAAHKSLHPCPAGKRLRLPALANCPTAAMCGSL